MVLVLKDSYGLWQGLLPHIAKTQRRTLGEKIDELFLATLEWAFRASYLSGQQKVTAIEAAVVRLDLVKFFLLVGWEIDMVTDKQYAHLSAPLVEASKMLVGWKEYLETKTPRA
ncbi:four helix bundle protein [Candidatus Kaiserbacteria bacterium]|nr:four helix bundle protein [Candidatus Kaiserbacteria bacterium]